MPTPDVIRLVEDAQVLELSYVPGETYSQLFQTDSVQQSHLTALVDTINGIRQVAAKNQNPNLLHTDPNPDNFIYHSGKAVALDPGCELRSGPGFEEVDRRINLQFLYELHGKNVQQYAEGFLETLKTAEVEALLELNSMPRSSSRAYFRLRSQAANLLKGRGLDSFEFYSPERVNTVTGLLHARLRTK